MKRYQIAIAILIFLLMIPAIFGFSGYIYKVGDKISIGRYSNDFDGAITAIGSSNYTLVIDTNITVTQDVTVPATCGLDIGRGGSLTYQDANVDLTINGPVQAGLYQWIDPNRDWVTFGDGAVDEVYPQWYYDGGGDYREAINAACQSIATSGGKLKFLAGTYQVDLDNGSLVPVSDMVIEGVGKESYIYGNGSRYSVTSNYNYLWLLTTQTNVIFRDLAMDGNSSTWAENPTDPDGAYTLIRFTPSSNNSVSDITIEGCYFTKSWNNGIGSYGYSGHSYPHYTTRNIKVRNCIFYDIGSHGVGMSEFIDSSVTECRFEDCGQKVMISGLGSGMGVDVSAGCKNIIVSNNLVDGGAAGFKAEAHDKTDTTLDGNEAAGQTILSVAATTDIAIGDTAGVVLNDASTWWSDITAFDDSNTITIDEALPSAADANNVVEIITRSKHVVIENNQIQDLLEGAGYTVWYGIRVNGENIVIKNNIIKSYSHGIDFSSYAKNCIVENNIIKETTYATDSEGIRILNNEGGHVISGNRISLTKTKGISCFAPNCTIRGNIVTRCGLTGNTGGIAVRDTNRCGIIGNICIDNYGPGIAVARSSGSLDNILVSENICIDTRSGASRTQTYGIYEDPTSATNIIMNGNRCYNNSTANISATNYLDFTTDNLALKISTDGALLKLGSYGYFSQTSSGGEYFNWGMSWDGSGNQWERQYIGASNYLPYMAIDNANNITFGGAVSNDPNDTNPTLSVKMQVEADTGRVGIGTTTPEGLLEVQGGVDTDAVIYLDANTGKNNADTWIIKSQAADNDLTFTNHATERMRLTDAGILDVSAGVFDTLNYASDTAADDDYIIALTPALSAYATGLSVYFDANNPNTGACTLNINGVGAASIKMLHDQDPGNNCIEDGSMVHVIYDGTNFQMLNPCAN